MLTVLVATAALSFIALTEERYEHLAKHLASSAVFLSNEAQYPETGYFDVAAKLKPLLHLWSLAVEEQFYLA